LFKKPRANPRTMYYEEQNTKLVFELEDERLTKALGPTAMPPAPMPTPAPKPPPAQSFVYNSLDKEQVPKVEVIESVPMVVNLEPVVVNLEPVVVNLEPVVVNLDPVVVNLEPVVVNLEPVVVNLEPVVVNLEPVVVNLESVVVNTSNNILETDPSIYAKYFTNFKRIIAPQTRKNYTIVVHYENKTSSILYSDYLGVIPIYMNVVTLMNPK